MPDHAGAVQYIAFLGRRWIEIKFATKQRVFIVESFARKQLTENVSASFVLKYRDSPVHTAPCVSKLVKKWRATGSLARNLFIYAIGFSIS
jgi:hypothetical protein